MKRYVIGDIHGARKALVQCLELVRFDYQTDLLVCLGDVCDGWPEVKESIETLLTIKNLVYILGNHDSWALEWMQRGRCSDSDWLAQGGRATIISYQFGIQIPAAHRELLRTAKPYYILDNKLFIHGGFDYWLPLEEQDPDVFLWDRTLAEFALRRRSAQLPGTLTTYDEVYVGHTPTFYYEQEEPIFAAEIIMMDTGAGYPGHRLTIMDIDSKHYFASDPVSNLYPGYKVR